MTISKTKAVLGIALAAIMACALLLVGCAGSSNSGSASKGSASSSATSQKSGSAQSSQATNYVSEVSPDDPYGKGIHHAVMTIEGYDPVTIELNADYAPVTVANFAKLANEGFYDGLTFYRFVEGFCMQGGSSNNSAVAANDGLEPIIGEFAGNGVSNPLAEDFKEGTVAMARNGQNPNSATSTFFVTLGSNANVGASLDNQYGAFGTISAQGMETINKVVADYLPKVTDKQMGSIDNVADQAKIVSIKMVD